MNFVFLLIVSIFLSCNNYVAFAYNEEDVEYFLKHIECHQCDLSNYNFENKYLDQAIITDSNLSGTNFNNVKMAKATIKTSDFSNATFIKTDMPTNC